MRVGSIDFPMDKIEDFCRRWKVTELALRDDFRPDSDIDLLVSFAPDAHWTLLDFVEMRDELSQLVGQNVDLVMREAVKESRRTEFRRHVFSTAQVIYAA